MLAACIGRRLRPVARALQPVQMRSVRFFPAQDDTSFLDKDEIITLSRGNVRVLQFNKLKTSNSLDLQSAHALNNVLFKWHDNYMVNAVVVTGVRSHFCTGADALALRRGGVGGGFGGAAAGGGGAPPAGAKLRREVARLAYRTRRYPLPLVTVANGAVRGSGVALLQSKFKCSTEDATFSVPEPLLGQGLEGGVSYALAGLTVGSPGQREPLPGLGTAIALSGITLNGQDMAWAGLVSNCVDDEDLEGLVTMMETDKYLDERRTLPMQMRKNATEEDLDAAELLMVGVEPVFETDWDRLEEFDSDTESDDDDDDDDDFDSDDEGGARPRRPRDTRPLRVRRRAKKRRRWLATHIEERQDQHVTERRLMKRVREAKAAVEAATALVAEATTAMEAEDDPPKRKELEVAAADASKLARVAAARLKRREVDACLRPFDLSPEDAAELQANFGPMPVTEAEWTDADEAADRHGVEDSERWIVDTEFGRTRSEPVADGGPKELQSGVWLPTPDPERLEEVDPRESDLAAWFTEPLPPCALQEIAPSMARCFDVDTLQEAVANVREAAASEQWAQQALDHMERCSPLALHAAFAQMKAAERLKTLEECLTMEIAVGDALARHSDYWTALQEQPAGSTGAWQGPQWSGSLSSIDQDAVKELFAQPPGFRVDLAGRD